MADFADDHLYEGLREYISELEVWFYAQQRIAYDTARLPDGKWRLCLGVLVYGSFLDRFLRYCIPSLLAPGNLDALFEPRIIIHTDAASIDRLKEAAIAWPDSWTVDIHTIPADIVEAARAEGGDHQIKKYCLLGTTGNLHMQQAKYRGYGYHMLMPDHVYAAGYFAGIARLHHRGEKAIVQGAMSGQMEQVGPLIEARGGVIEPEELNAMVLDHLHPQLAPFVMNGGRSDYPASMLLLMVAPTRAHIISPHMTLIYLSHDLLMRAPLRLVNTLDAQLPFFIPEDIDPYVPNADDRMAYAELSDASRPPHKLGGLSLLQFCMRFWFMAYCCRGFERFFGLTTIMPFPPGYRPAIDPMTEDEIAAMKALVRESVADSYQQVYDVVPNDLRIDPILRAKQRIAEQTQAAA